MHTSSVLRSVAVLPFGAHMGKERTALDLNMTGACHPMVLRGMEARGDSRLNSEKEGSNVILKGVIEKVIELIHKLPDGVNKLVLCL